MLYALDTFFLHSYSAAYYGANPIVMYRTRNTLKGIRTGYSTTNGPPVRRVYQLHHSVSLHIILLYTIQNKFILVTVPIYVHKKDTIMKYCGPAQWAYKVT